jgi:hypothetical protein
MSEKLLPEFSPDYWRKCSSCKKPIAYKALYWVCNVSTCNRKRTGLHFCSVSCWDAHVPQMNHRESWAEERNAPTLDQWKKTLAGEGEEEKKPRAKKEESAPQEAAAVSKPSSQSAPSVILRRRT